MLLHTQQTTVWCKHNFYMHLETKHFMWLGLLKYSLYCSALEQNPQSEVSLCSVCVLSRSLCLTLFDPKDCSLPGSSADGILQERILEWVTIPFSRGSSRPRDRPHAACIVGRFFTVRASREPLCYYSGCKKQQEIFMEITTMSSPKMTGYLYI